MPNTRHSRRSEQAAISSTCIMPSTSSIRHSMPMRRFSFELLLPADPASDARTSRPRRDLALVSMMVSRFAPAPVTTSMMSSWHHSVSTSLMRTQRVAVSSRASSAPRRSCRGRRLWRWVHRVFQVQKDVIQLQRCGFGHHFFRDPGTESWQRLARRGCWLAHRNSCVSVIRCVRLRTPPCRPDSDHSV